MGGNKKSFTNLHKAPFEYVVKHKAWNGQSKSLKGWVEKEPLLGVGLKGVVLLNNFYIIACRDMRYLNSDHPEFKEIAKHLGHSRETTKLICR